ncbi:MAG: YceI family protein [Sulfuricurvum sp.]|uniref:YceI family protein n=1 Tax=Sulfuricurvum sp. TaxID=2025608 RepID=UPI0025E708E1|nr:YceI family protein [Sulfuricurvum sp.]MBV5320059.1 YceI family protein [Sulfuricurvum sp.]
MIKISIAALLLASSLTAGSLSFESGSIKAHTEVFGDTTIDPMTKKATSHLSMDASPTTLKGSIEISMSDLFSDNKKRDEHMQEALESSSFPKAVFDLKEVVSKGGDNYVLKGTMNLHGVSKAMNFDGTITEEGNKVRIKAQSSMKMTDFGIKLIKMMFLTVRDQVDLSVDVGLKR